MRINKKLIPSKYIRTPYREPEYVEMNKLGDGIATVMLALAVIVAIPAVIVGLHTVNANAHKTWSRQCDIIAGKQAHFVTGSATPTTQAACKIAPDFHAVDL